MRLLRIPQHKDMQMEEVFLEGAPIGYQQLQHELKCDMVERVRIGWATSRIRFEDVVMIVDEMGRYKPELQTNIRASYLYGMHIHGTPIVGDALLIGEGWEEDSDGGGIVFQDLPPNWTIETVDELLAHDDGDALLPK